MKRLSHILAKIEDTLVAVSLGGATVIIVLSVIMRYVFHNALSWGEEGAILLLIYTTFIGASVVLREREHVGIDIVTLKMGDRGKLIMALIGMGITAVYCGLLGFLGWIMATSPSALNTVTPALRVPIWMVQVAVPIGLTLMFLRAVEALWLIALGKEEPKQSIVEESIEQGGL